MNRLGGMQQRIRKIFVEAGITDPLEMLKHMAALLLMLTKHSLADEETGQYFTAVPSVVLQDIRPLIQEDLRDPNGIGAGDWFRMLLYAWVKSAGVAGQYPTPEGLPQLMARLTKPTDGDSVLDLACGAGTLLAAALVQGGVSLRVTGVEPDPDWSRLAWANVALHGARQARVLTKSAEHLSGLGSFQVVLIHPPVGLELKNIMGLGREERVLSETALTHIAVQALAENGRACFLVPSDFLATAGSAEVKVRRGLVTDAHLRAVVTLPDAIQAPFSRSGSHLLYLEKAPSADRRTWFIQFPSPIGRLRAEPPGWWADLLDDLLHGRPSVGVLKLEGGSIRAAKWRQLGGAKGPVGCVLEPDTAEPGQTETGRFSSVELITSENGTVLLAAVTDADGHMVGRVLLRAGSEPKLAIGARDVVLRRYLDLRPDQSVPEPRERILVDAEPGAALLLTPSLELVGITGSPNAVEERAESNLLPEAILPKQRRSEPQRTPEEILVHLFHKQRELQARVERLFSTFAEPVILDSPIPPGTVYGADKPQVAPQGLFGRLSAEQMRVWQQVREARQEDLPGIAKTVLPSQLEVPEPDGVLGVETTLDLLRRMGGVLPITIEGVRAYRLVTTWDRWDDWDNLDEEVPQTLEDEE